MSHDAEKKETYNEWVRRVEAAEALVILAAQKAVETGRATSLIEECVKVLDKVNGEKP